MSNMQRIDMLMPQKMIDKLDRFAENTFDTRSNIIRRAVNEFCDKHIDKFIEGNKNGKRSKH